MRQAGARALAVLFALGWLMFPGFGLIDLSVTWSSAWPEVLEAGWGLFATVIVAASFALVGLRPREPAPGILQLVLGTLCLGISTVAASEWRLVLLVALLAAETAVVGALVRAWWSPARRETSMPVLVVAVAGAVPWSVYAVHMWQSNGTRGAGGDTTVGIDHYSVQGALGIALALLPLVAAFRGELRPFCPVCAGIAASYLGLVSLRWPGAAAGLGRVWSAVAIVWGVALLASALHSVRSSRGAPEGALASDGFQTPS